MTGFVIGVTVGALLGFAAGAFVIGWAIRQTGDES